jgi:DNA-binding protein inhibitor ID
VILDIVEFTFESKILKMKSIVDPSSERERSRTNSNNVLGIRSQDSKVHKSKHKEEESAEIKVYLTQLKELVPFMPKHKKLSKLEVITYVIDYIRDLRQTLGLPPNSSRMSSSMDFDDESSLDMLSLDSPKNSSSSSSLNVISGTAHSPRQPLGVITSPNNGSLSSCGSLEFPQLLDKSPSADVDTRPVSC